MSVEGSAICRFKNPAYDNSWIITSRKEELRNYSYIFHSFLRGTGSARTSEHIRAYVGTNTGGGSPTSFFMKNTYVTWPSVDQFRIPELGIDRPQGYRNARWKEKNISRVYGRTVIFYSFGGNGRTRILRRGTASSIVFDKRFKDREIIMITIAESNSPEKYETFNVRFFAIPITVT